MNYLENKKFGDLLTDHVLSKLTGQHDDFKRKTFNKLPSRDIPIGVLFGKEPNQNEDDAEKDIFDTFYRSNSISVKFLLKDTNHQISIIPSLSTYTKTPPTFEEQTDENNDKIISDNFYTIAKVWKRHDLEFEEIILDVGNHTHELNFKEKIKDIKNSSDFLKKNFRIKKEAMESEKSYNEFVESKQKANTNNKENIKLNWDCEIKITKENFAQNNEKLKLIEITLTNKTDDLTTDSKVLDMFEPAIFNPKLKIKCENEIVPFSYNYDYEGKSMKYESYFRCNNCQATLNDEKNIITTQSYGEFEEEKIIPKSDIPGIDITFEKMASSENIEELTKILNSIDEYYNSCNNNTDSFENLTNFLNMRNKFNQGIQSIKEDENTNKAFELMNKTFAEKSKNEGYHSWRLFQIVFIVSEISDIINEENRGICDLLHVKTGGGKSEAYFGIVLFTAFYDRIRGKEFGVTAITKFPLRMLSVQQLQRIAVLFIFAEEIRKEEKLKGDPFSIAYFVGSQEDEFPRHNRSIRRSIENAKKDETEIPGKIINECPICGGEVILDVDEAQEVIIHKCKQCGRIFRLYYSDDEIYRMLPTFIVATVDKFAGISMNRRIKSLFGGKIDKADCGHGFIPHNDKCEFEEGRRKHCRSPGKEFKVKFNTGPTLIIQDEMHLVREGFGTIDSHFETLTETLQEEMGGHKFKNIVMTATVTGAKNQIKNLYNKGLNIFPPKLQDANNKDFFFEQLVDDNNENMIQRKIIGLKPNSVNTRIVLHILRYITDFIESVETNKENFSNKYGIELDNLDEILTLYKTMLTYHNKKENVHTINFHMDDYVNKLSEYNVESRPLTGDNDLDYIKETIAQVNEFDEEEQLHAVHATNIVSHGVDIDRWNLMIFEGMPRSTAEYIQSLSRVGRKYYGIVFLTFDSRRTRDLSFFKHFYEYHNIIEYKVEPVPLARWAKLGIKQTITSVFTASILNYLSNELNKPLYNIEQVREVLIQEQNVNLLLDFINKSYVTFIDDCDDETKKEIEKEIRERIYYLINYTGTQTNFFPNALKDCENKYYRTQFGMRGIQDEIQLTPYKRDFNFRKSLRG